GNRALFLLFRHPSVFAAAAAWDAPAQFMDMTAPCCSASMTENFGTDANFAQYAIPPLVAAAGAPFTSANRIWISGDQSAWTEHMLTLDQQMTAAGVQHTWVAGGFRPHHWASGWVDGALAALNEG